MMLPLCRDCRDRVEREACLTVRSTSRPNTFPKVSFRVSRPAANRAQTRALRSIAIVCGPRGANQREGWSSAKVGAMCWVEVCVAGDYESSSSSSLVGDLILSKSQSLMCCTLHSLRSPQKESGGALGAKPPHVANTTHAKSSLVIPALTPWRWVVSNHLT